jgi:chemotaxis protein histidine kinase CheA
LANRAAEIEDRLRKLKESFRRDLPRRCGEIDAAWRRLRDQGAGIEAAAAAHRQAHSLAGAAGTFGFPEIGALATALEQQLEVLARSAAAPSVEQSALIADMIARLARMSNAPGGSPTSPASAP